MTQLRVDPQMKNSLVCLGCMNRASSAGKKPVSMTSAEMRAGSSAKPSIMGSGGKSNLAKPLTGLKPQTQVSGQSSQQPRVMIIGKNEDLNSRLNTPVMKKTKVKEVKEQINSYYCNHCRYSFKRKATLNVDTCPYCGKRELSDRSPVQTMIDDLLR